MKNNWLIIAAHPDDEVLGCGGIMAKYKDTVNFIVLVVAEGSTCRFDDYKSERAQEAIKIRNESFIDSMTELQVSSYELHNFPCGRLDQIPIIEINKIIENIIVRYKPKKIFTHSFSDTNNDHRIVARATEMACRPSIFEFIDAIYAYEVLSTSECSFDNPFSPNFFFKLDENNVEEKWAALEKYSTEIKAFPFPRSKEAIFSLARYRGLQSGHEYCEAFKLLRGRL